MDYLHMALLVCPLIFAAAFIDSIAGGGGLISLPAYLLTGMPAQMAHGCNKFSAFIGTGVSTLRFFKSGRMDVQVALVSAVLALVGSAIGVRFSLLMAESVFRGLILVVVPVMAALILWDSVGNHDKLRPLLPRRALLGWGVVFGFFIGMYDGLVGPGTGTIMIWCQTRFMGFDHVTASGNAKAANMASNTAAAVLLIAAGKVIYPVAVPAALCGVAGNWLGSGLAIKKGAGLVRGMMIVVVVLMLLKLGADYLL